MIAVEKDELIEKLARLETRVDIAIQQANEDRSNLHEIMDNIREINTRLARYEGKMGGIILVMGLLWSGVLFFKDAIIRHLKGG